MRKMIGTLFVMCGGLMMSKLRILDGPTMWDFNLGNSGLVGNSNHRYVKFQNYHYCMDSLPVTFLQVMASNIVQGTTLTALPSFLSGAC